MPDAPLQAAAIVGVGPGRLSPVAFAALERDLDPTHTDEPTLKILEQRLIRPANHEQQLNVSERRRW